MAIDAKLLEILACPDCKTKVVAAGDVICCTNPDCRRSYPVDDGIPVMLIDESTVLAPDAWKETVDQAEGM